MTKSLTVVYIMNGFVYGSFKNTELRRSKATNAIGQGSLQLHVNTLFDMLTHYSTFKVVTPFQEQFLKWLDDRRRQYKF